MRTNFVGTFSMTRAFVPVLEHNGGGAIVNLLSLVVFGSVRHRRLQRVQGRGGLHHPGAAPQLGDQGIGVHGVFPARWTRT